MKEKKSAISSSNTVHIAIDHGNKMQKIVYDDDTVDDLVFESGLHVSKDEPVSNRMTVKFNGNYYTVASGRIPVQVEKSKSLDSFIFTMAGIGHYMCEKGINKLEVILSVGLPLLHYTDQKQSFKQYFDRSDVLFDYEDRKGLKVSIKECFVWPQNYSSYLQNKVRKSFINTEVVIIDFGSYTIDLGRVSTNGLIDASSVTSLSNGIIKLYKKIQSELFKKGFNISESQIDQILLEENPIIFDDEVISTVENEAKKYVDFVFGTISEHMELKLIACYILGGASIALKEYISTSKHLRYYELEEDIKSNAKGYLALTKAFLKKRAINEQV